MFYTVLFYADLFYTDLIYKDLIYTGLIYKDLHKIIELIFTYNFGVIFYMKIGICNDRTEESWTFGISGEIFFSPLFEMFAAMHVICNPEHHTGSLDWWKRVKRQVDESLLDDIKALSDLTMQWLVPCDFVITSPYNEIRDMDIEEALRTLESYNIRHWKKIFGDNNCSISLSEKNRIIEVSRSFYDVYFKQEIMIIEPIMTSALRKVLIDWEKEGIAKASSSIHERLKFTKNDIIFYKDKEYHYKYNDLNKIYLTGSTFLSPHLIMGYRDKALLLVRYFGRIKESTLPPKDLVGLYKGLADGTRLQILRCLKHMPDSTQHLSVKLGITEAAVSKQLKVLSEAGLVTKARKGNYMIYAVDEKALDFLTYRIYEYLM